ncbi:hypothetical protein ABPG72_005576 [Tetrahymena utriculariae]
MNKAVYIIIEQFGIILIALHSLSWSIIYQIDGILQMKILIINFVLTLMLFFLAISLYFLNKQINVDQKNKIVSIQLVIYCSYYVLFIIIVLFSQQYIIKDYILQTFVVCLNLWSHLSESKYKYAIIIIFQLVSISICLSVTKISDDIWNYVIITLAFLISLFSIEYKIQTQQNTIKSSVQSLQQEINHQKQQINSITENFQRKEQNINSKNQFQFSIKQKQLDKYSYEEEILNKQEHKEALLKSQNQNLQHLSKFEQNKDKNDKVVINQYREINDNQTLPITPKQLKSYNFHNFTSNGNYLTPKQNMLNVPKDNDELPLTSINFNSNKLILGENQFYFSPTKFNFMQNNQKEQLQHSEENSLDSKSQNFITNVNIEKIQIKNQVNLNQQPTKTQHGSTHSLRIDDIFLQRKKSQDLYKQMQIKQQIIIPSYDKQIVQSPLNIIENTQQNVNLVYQPENITYQIPQMKIQAKNNFYSQNKSAEQKDFQGYLNGKIKYEQINQSQTRDKKSKSSGCIMQNINFFQIQNLNQDKKACQKEDAEQLKKPIHSKNKSKTHVIQIPIQNNKNQSNDNNAKLQNISFNIRQKLYDLEKEQIKQNDTNLLNQNNALIIQKYQQSNQKQSFQRKQLKSLTQQYNNKGSHAETISQFHKDSQFLKNDQYLKNEYMIDKLQDQYYKIIYESIDNGIIILNEQAQIVHKNKQIYNMFHQFEVNDNLISFLKVAMISEKSLNNLKQILLQKSKALTLNKIQQNPDSLSQIQISQKNISSFLEKINQQALREQPISLKELIQSLIDVFQKNNLRSSVQDQQIEVFQVFFNQSYNQTANESDQQNINNTYMSVQFKINLYYRSEINQYECMLNFINTRDHDISIKKEISENISYRIFQTLSHEFGTYMNIISNITENALEDDKISVELKKDYFRIINTNSILLENVVKDMRDFFSIMNQKLEVQIKDINLKETVFQILELFKKQLQLKKLKTQIKIQKGIDTEIKSDESFIKQILSNFISNSLKFTLQGQINIYLFKESEKYIRLEVEDSGIGMSSEECERLKGMLKNGFSDQKISKNSVGFGFGLLVSNNLARLIGNPIKKQAIYFDSSPQGGSRFWILVRDSTNPNQKQKDQRAVFQKISIFSEKQISDQDHQRKSNSILNKIPLHKGNQSFLQDQKSEENLSNIHDSFIQIQQEPPRNVQNQNLIKQSCNFKKNKPNLTVQINQSLKDVKQYELTQKVNKNQYSLQYCLQDQSEMDIANYNSKNNMNQDKPIQKETKNLDIIQNLSNKSNSPLKSSFSINQQRRKGSIAPMLSLESTQMVNSKIIQLRSRVRHTIVNKLNKPLTSEQIEAPSSLAGSAVNNTLNKIFLLQTKNYQFTQEGSNIQSSNQKSPHIGQTPQSIQQQHQQLQFLNSTLSQGNHLNVTHNQSPQKAKEGFLIKSLNQNSTILGNLNYYTQNHIRTSNEFDQKQLQIFSINNESGLKISQEKVFNQNPQTTTMQNINTRKIINYKIEEEQIEDDTKQNNSLQYYSENYSSSQNENNSSRDASKSSHNIYEKIKTQKSTEFNQLFEEKMKKNNSNVSNQKQKRENKQYENKEQKNQKQSSALSQAETNNLSISQLDDIVQSLSNSSTSFQQVNQRDLLECQEYQFNENFSLDDLDAINNLEIKQINQKLDFQAQQAENKNIQYLNHKKNSLTQNTATLNINNSHKLENILEDFKFIQPKTFNDINSPKIKKKKHSPQDNNYLCQTFDEDLEIDELDNNDKNLIPIQKNIQKKMDLNYIQRKTSNFSQEGDKNKSNENVTLIYKQNQSNSTKNILLNSKTNSPEFNAISFGREDKLQFNSDLQQSMNNSLDSKQNQRNSQNQKQGQKQKNIKPQIRFQQPIENVIHQQSAQHQIDQNQYQSIYTSQINQENIQKKQFTLNNLPTCTMNNLNVDEHDICSPIKIKAYQRKSQDNTQLLQQQKKILLVDDEIFNIFSLKLIFQKFGLSDNILEAYNGQQAIQILLNQQNQKQVPNNQDSYQIGMIIMDVNMPIMNGIECTRYIRELENSNFIDYSPNIIGYTAYSDSQTRNMCFDAGMDDLLLKPSRRDDFIAIIEKYFLSI